MSNRRWSASEIGEALAVKGGIISFPLKKHDFILIEAETK